MQKLVRDFLLSFFVSALDFIVDCSKIAYMASNKHNSNSSPAFRWVELVAAARERQAAFLNQQEQV